MRRECQERFCRHYWLAIPTCITAHDVTHVARCMPEPLTSGFLWSHCRGKRSHHSQTKCKPQFHVSGKRHMELVWMTVSYVFCSPNMKRRWLCCVWYDMYTAIPFLFSNIGMCSVVRCKLVWYHSPLTACVTHSMFGAKLGITAWDR